MADPPTDRGAEPGEPPPPDPVDPKRAALARFEALVGRIDALPGGMPCGMLAAAEMPVPVAEVLAAVRERVADCGLVREVTAAPHKRLRVETTALYPDGSTIDVYVEAYAPRPVTLRLSDLGNTTAWLHDAGHPSVVAAHGEPAVAAAISPLGVGRDGGMFLADVGDLARLPGRLAAFTTACQRVAALGSLSAASLASLDAGIAQARAGLVSPLALEDLDDGEADIVDPAAHWAAVVEYLRTLPRLPPEAPGEGPPLPDFDVAPDPPLPAEPMSALPLAPSAGPPHYDPHESLACVFTDDPDDPDLEPRPAGPCGVCGVSTRHSVSLVFDDGTEDGYWLCPPHLTKEAINERIGWPRLPDAP